MTVYVFTCLDVYLFIDPMRNPFVISLVALILMLILSIGIGSVIITPAELWRVLTGMTSNETFRSFLWDIRLPRTMLITLVGAALGGSGAAYQGLFRNPLADPYLIGVASGAGLGAVIAMSFQWPYSFWGLFVVPLAAFATALLTVAIVYAIARIGHTVSTTNLILAGFSFSF